MPQNKPRPSDNPSAPVPRRPFVGVVALALSMAVIFAIGLWVFYQQSREHLDDEFGLRLQSVAVTAAATVPGDSLLVWWLADAPAIDVLLLSRALDRVEVDNSLSRIVVYQSDKSVLLDTGQLLPAGESDPFLSLDLAAVEQARSGIPSFTELQRVAGTYLKAGYAPVFDSYDEVAGFVGVVASASFFATLERLRRTLFVVGVTSVGFVTVLTLLVLMYLRRLALTRAALQRNETLTAMGRMAAGIAHEIRNPLGIIKNTAQLLKEDLQEAGIDATLVEFIPQEVDRLNETLTGYLDFAKDAPLRREQVDVCRLLRRTLSLMTPDFRNAEVRVLDNLDELGQLDLYLDARRMQQVFLNLFLNSIQAMPEGGELSVHVSATATSGRLEIRDNGVGLDPALAKEIFEPFVTTREQGSGLGLSVVRKIVEDHEGGVSMETVQGHGATVVVELPRSAAD